MEKQLIFQLGVKYEHLENGKVLFQAPRLEQNHIALSSLDNTACYSVSPGAVPPSVPTLIHYPETSLSKLFECIDNQQSEADPEQSWTEGIPYKAFEHFVEQTINEIETTESGFIDLAICYGSAINSWVMANINSRRIAKGKPEAKILYVATANDHSQHSDLATWIQETGLFGEHSPVHVCTASTPAETDTFLSHYAHYPEDRMIDHQPGYNASLYKPDHGAYSHRKDFLQTLLLQKYDDGAAAIDVSCEKVVVVNASATTTDFLDAVIKAAQAFESTQNAATLVISDACENIVTQWQKLAHDQIGLDQVYFLRPQTEEIMAKINAIADVAIQLVKNPADTMSLLQFLGCGTPVVAYAEDEKNIIGLIDETVGRMILPCKKTMLTAHLERAVSDALESNWKISKGGLAATVAMEQYSRASQCDKLLRDVEYCVAHSDSFTQHPDLLRQSILC